MSDETQAPPATKQAAKKAAKKKTATKTADKKPKASADQSAGKKSDEDLIAKKVKAGLSPEQAREVIAKQKAHDKSKKS